MGVDYIPLSSIALMAVEMLLGLILPIAAVIFWYKKKKGSIIPILIGAATFFVSAVVLEGIFHALFLVVITPVADFINSNFFVYAVYGSFMAGIFEETGRFAAFKLMKKRYGSLTDAVSYGIGHGGFECAYVLGIGIGSYVLIAIMINMGLGNLIFGSMGEAEMAAMEPILDSIITITPMYVLAAVAERISAMTFHTCNSVIVFNGVKKGKIGYLFAAIALHGAFNMVALLASQYCGIALTEAFLLAFAAFFAFFVFKLKKGEV